MKILRKIFILFLIIIRTIINLSLVLLPFWIIWYLVYWLNWTQALWQLVWIFFTGFIIIECFKNNLHKQFWELLKWLPWFYIYSFKKSKLIFKTALLTTDNFVFLLSPFAWKSYYDLEQIDKEVLDDETWKKFTIQEWLNAYFKRKKLKEIRVNNIDIEDNDFTTIRDITLNYSLDYWKKDLDWIDSDDILRSLGWKIKLYDVSIEILNNIRIIITDNVIKTLKIQDYINTFEENTIPFWVTKQWFFTYKLDFSNANHFLICGKAGYWKSNLAKSILYSLYTLNKDYQFVFFDYKKDFSSFKNVSRIKYADEPKEMLKICKFLDSDMKKRKDILSSKQLTNLQEYKQKYTNLKPVFIFIEEFWVLTDSLDKRESEYFIDIVKNIAREWRSLWYNFILSTQLPNEDEVKDKTLLNQLKPISFAMKETMKYSIFGTWFEYDLKDLKKWEAVIQIDWKDTLFKSFLIETNLVNGFTKKNQETKSLEEQYFEYAKNVNSFNKEEALTFWLKEKEFTNLSKKLQDEWVIKKLANNSLIFNKMKDEPKV